MKKSLILILSFISILITFFLGKVFSIYSFGSVPRLLTIIYLLVIFGFIEYFFIVGAFVIKKILNKEKLGIKKIFGLILLIFFLILLFLYLIILDIDYLNWYMYSTPFYINVVVRSLEFLLPAIGCFVGSIYLLKK